MARTQNHGPFYLLEVQDGVEKQRIPVTLDISIPRVGRFEVKVCGLDGGVSVTPGSFESFELVIIREDGEALFIWPVDTHVQDGYVIYPTTLAFGDVRLQSLSTQRADARGAK